MIRAPCAHRIPASQSFLGGNRLVVARRPVRVAKLCVSPVVAAATADAPGVSEERFRLNNLSPQEGSRRPRKRKGRGHAAGQGASCGFGMRGQKSRSGPGIRTGFEGGQTPLYRRLPKLKGIAGGMAKGRDKFVAVNLSDLNEKFNDGDIVSLEALKERRVLKTHGKERKLPLKVLGDGELEKKITIKAAQFSKSALEKIESAGSTVEVIPLKKKWTRQWYEEQVRAGKIKPKSKFWRTRFAYEEAKAKSS
ncbi:hypothetical protein BSKO_11613 [Bryopsis sp. KO-2023]|nr:hypothetical protein BSKO_11613 [Bryopsis sp. KO-2023]